MLYIGSSEQKMWITKRIQTLLSARRYSVNSLTWKCNKWVADQNADPKNKRKIDPISHVTMARYANHNHETDPDPDWKERKAPIVFEFLQYEIEEGAVLDEGGRPGKGEAAALLHVVNRHFKVPHGMPRANLDSLTGGSYAMFRRLWSQPDGEWFIRSIMTIVKEGDAYSYHDWQQFKDPSSGDEIVENDRGYLFMFGSNVFALGREDQLHCMKFISMHSFSPGLNGTTKVNWCKGNLIGLSTSAHEHPGYRFMLRRILGGEDQPGLIRAKDLDRLTREFLLPARRRDDPLAEL